MSMSWMVITPEIASAWLAHGNENNRKFRKHVGERYATSLLKGEWGKCATPIVIEKGQVLDGQHRLWAIVRTGVPMPALVHINEGYKPEDFYHRPAPRSLADYLDQAYRVPSAGRVVTIMGML